MPGGIFTPTFAMGAVFGQLYVAVVFRLLNSYGVDLIEYRGVYSILGAAAMTASVTRTVSVAMIVLELNGHLSHAVPIMVCVLASYATSEYLKPESFFEMLANLGELDKKVAQKGNIIVRDLLEINPEYKENLEQKYLSLEDSTESDLIEIVRRNGVEEVAFSPSFLPVVDNHKNRNLLFMIRLEEAQRYCEGYFDSNDYDETDES